MKHTNQYYQNKQYGDWWFIKCEFCGGKQSRHKTEKLPVENVIEDEKQDILCPFCEEGEFDLIGLKHHLKTYCEAYRKTENI